MSLEFEDTQTLSNYYNRAEAREEIRRLNKKGFYAYKIKIDEFKDKYKIKYRKYRHKFYRQHERLLE